MAENQAETATKSPRRMILTSKEFLHKPVIRDILRTGSCRTGSIFLVEKVESIEETLSNPSAIRLLLGDGKFVIQAFLNPQTCRLVESGEVTIGCYVRLDTFNIRRIDVEGSGLPSDNLTKRKRPQQVVFLEIRQLESVGWDDEYQKHARTAMEDPTREDGRQNGQDADRDKGDITETADASRRGSGTREFDDKAPIDELCSLIRTSEPAMKKRIIHRPAVPPEPLQNTATQESDHQRVPLTSDTVDPKPPREIHVPSPKQAPLAPRSLASLSKLPARQNSPCTVFAVVDEIKPLKPCPIPPHQTREVRLVDPTTTKRVLLSVLWQPEKFNPPVGTPVLLRGLKNHRYDGGSLNAYPKSVSPYTQNDDGTDWWVPFPRGWDGCDVDGYLEWWELRQKETKLDS